MPELPEVETVRIGLAPVMEGIKVARLVQRRPDLRFPFPENFAQRLEGRTITRLARRAKYLWAEIDSGETLVMHLGMSGRFSIAAPEASQGARIGAYVHETGNTAAHDHVTLHMHNGTAITYNDPRRFGFMLLVPTAELEAHALFRDIGVEPLGDELTPDHVATRAQGRKTDLKAFLLDQRNIAGLGNIYVAEALFRAHLNPKRAASLLALRNGGPSPHAMRLVPEIKAVLGAALQAGGSTLRDYRQADGSAGEFQDRFSVYGRTGAACPGAACTGTIKRIVQAGRSTFYCPKCQR
jgi:formamidopyrimidine-DNA glycosylase